MLRRSLASLLLLLSVPVAVLAALTADEKRLADYVDAHAADFARDLEAAVQIDSPTENHAGVRAVGELFAGQLRQLGFATEFLDLAASTGRAGHLVAEHRGTRGQRILLLGHLDTVLPGGNWRREGDTAFGSGTNDMKGGDLVMLHALRALHATGLLAEARIIVIFTGDEEAVGQPQARARQAMHEAAQRSDLVLSFETAIGRTATVARRGSASWELEVQGATGHSSGIFSEAMGAGAIYEAARIIENFYTELRKLNGLTCSPAMIVGGTEAELDRTGGRVSGKTNIVAQRVLARGDLRTLSAAQLAEAQATMQAVVAASLPRTSAKLSFSEGYPAMPDTPANRELLARLDAVSRDLGYGEITAYDPRGRGAGDVAFVSPPLPGLDGLGVHGRGAHAPNETADLASVPELVKRTAVLIHRLARTEGKVFP